jgi:hypothetical protein
LFVKTMRQILCMKVKARKKPPARHVNEAYNQGTARPMIQRRHV